MHDALEGNQIGVLQARFLHEATVRACGAGQLDGRGATGRIALALHAATPELLYEHDDRFDVRPARALATLHTRKSALADPQRPLFRAIDHV